MARAAGMAGICGEKSETEVRRWCPRPLPQPPPSSSFFLLFQPKSLNSTCRWLLVPSPLFYFFLLFFSLVSLLALLFVFPSGLYIIFFLFLPVTLSDSLQMDVVSAFQSGTSFQGALRRQASNSSQQQHDVTNVSSPTHVAFSTTTTTTATAVNSASATVGCECVFSSSA